MTASDPRVGPNASSRLIATDAVAGVIASDAAVIRSCAKKGNRPSAIPVSASASGGATSAGPPSWASGVSLAPGWRQKTRIAATPATATAIAPNTVLAARAKAKTSSALFTSAMTSLTT